MYNYFDCVSNLHKIYLLGDECKDNCNGYYQFETSSSEVHYIKCFDTLTEALSDDNVKFYDATQKKCWKNFPNKNTYFIKSSFTDSDTNYEVVNECDYFYNEIEDPTDNTKTCYQCVDNCKTINKYFEIGSKKCENSCNKFNKYYYDASNNECLPSCDSRPNKPFSMPLTIEDVNTLPTPKECLTSCDSTSNNKYYNYNSNICITSCGTDDSSNLYYKRTTSTDTTHKNKCFPSCKDIPGGNYKYELSDNSCTNTEITTFPSTDSITHVQYDFYYRKNDGVIKYVATSDCQNLNYIYIEGNECKRNCNNNYYKLEVEIDSNTFIKCFSEPSGCLTGRTNSDNKIYYNQNLKKCWEGTTGMPTNYFIKEIDTDLYELVNECDNFYYNDNSLNYCISICSNNGVTSAKYFITGNKQCLTLAECFSFHKYYYDDSNNECLNTCKGRSTNKFQKELPSPLPTESQKCLEECPKNNEPPNEDFPYYNYDSNICLTHCGADGSNKKYHAENGYICYSSCKEIPGGDYIYESIDQDDNIKICSSTIFDDGNCELYYMKKDGTLKCLGDADIASEACSNMEYKYILGQECRKECNDYYILEDDISNNGLIKCFKTKEDCLDDTVGGVYYNVKLKKCWKNYPTGYYLKDDSTNEVLEECEKYYYKNFVIVTPPNTGYNKYICTESCNEITTADNPDGLFYISGQKNCEDSCKVFSKYYFDPSNNECLETCIGRNNLEYADDIDFSSTSSQPTQCKAECDSSSQHYNYGTKICLDTTSCDEGKFTKKENTKNICYDSCAEIPSSEILYEIGTECYIKTQITDFENDCKYYFKRDDNTIKCVDSLESCQNSGYNYVFKKECKKTCGDYYKYKDTTNNDIIICYENYESAYNDNNDILYYDRTLKELWKELPDNMYILYDNNGANYEIVQICESYYYEKEEGKNYCKDNCKSVNLFFEKNNKQCKSSCALFNNKNYYNPTNNECLDTCSVLDNYKFSNKITTGDSGVNIPEACKELCPNYYIKYKDNNNNIIYECYNTCPPDDDSLYKLIDIKTKECLQSCDDNQIEDDEENPKYCYPKCDIDNGYFYINTDTYECAKTCPSYLKKLEFLVNLDGTDIFLCKSSCKEDEYRLEDKCLTQCPSDYNFIGYNKICKAESCAQDPCTFNYGGDTNITASKDNMRKIWSTKEKKRR